MVTITQIQEKLIKEMKQSHITQSVLANRLGIKQQTVSAYMTGKKMPALDTFANLCAILELDANEILCLHE